MKPATLDQELFDELAGGRGDGLVSILVPTHVKGPEVAQDRIRLKNALTEVDEFLSDGGWRRSKRESRLATARGLMSDDDFWAHQGQGLALYIDEAGDVFPVAMSDEPSPLTCVADSYHVRHLLPELMRSQVDALVLTKGSVVLYSVDPRHAAPVDADLPASMDDVNWFLDREAQLQNRSDRVGSAGNHHGHDPSDRRDEDVQRFLRAVSHALPQGGDTIVVLGDEPLIDGFRRVCRRPVIGIGLDGTDRADSPAEVLRRVRPVIDDRFTETLGQNHAAAEEALGTADTVTLFPDALGDAISGRLARLFLAHGADPIWGRFDPTTNEATAGGERAPGTVDLLDRLAVAALGTGAEVLPMSGSATRTGFVGVRRF